MGGYVGFYIGIDDGVCVVFLMDNKRADNPFYNNHVFTDFDRGRMSLDLTWGEKFFLFFKPTYVQLSGDHVYYYKRLSGRYYLLKVALIKER